MNKNASIIIRIFALLLLVVMTFSMVGCDKLPFDLESIFGGGQDNNGDDENEKPECPHELVLDGKCFDCDAYLTITIAEAIEIANENPDGTSERYYIRATVKTVLNAQYGEMYITDDTGELYVYGTRGLDDTFFDKLPETPVKGDEVLLHCQLSMYNGAPQVKKAFLVEFTHVDIPFDANQYTEMTIQGARDAEAGALVRVKGVVAQITYANGMIPSGVILVDGTSSIYVYSRDVAAQAKVGNTIEVAAEKTYWILEGEKNSAEKFGYVGANQLDNATIISNDKGNTKFDKSWITETTVKEIMDTPVSEDITNKIFKATALVKKVPGTGFTNYYIDDLDGFTGSYVYTQCNGGDFGWIDEFDGEICTVYFVAINAKSSTSGCIWRFLPIEIIDEDFKFDEKNAPKFAVDYYGTVQFLPSYTGDPAKELVTELSSELLGFEGVSLSYSSDNESVVYFEQVDGKTIFHCGEAGEATVTVTAKHGTGSYTDSVKITVSANAEFDTISIADAIGKEVNEEVIVRGIVGPSLVNQAGFYLFDESGMVAIRVFESSVFDTIEIGNEVVIKGKRDLWHKEGYEHGQICISNATVEANYYGNNDYLTIEPIMDKDINYLLGLNKLDMSETTKLYQMEVTIKVVDAQFYSNIYVTDGENDLILYCSGSGQYSWLKAYNGQTVTVEIAPCNWNSKAAFAGCVLAVVNEDGSKVLNEFNFK